MENAKKVLKIPYKISLFSLCKESGQPRFLLWKKLWEKCGYVEKSCVYQTARLYFYTDFMNKNTYLSTCPHTLSTAWKGYAHGGGNPKRKKDDKYRQKKIAIL